MQQMNSLINEKIREQVDEEKVDEEIAEEMTLVGSNRCLFNERVQYKCFQRNKKDEYVVSDFVDQIL